MNEVASSAGTGDKTQQPATDVAAPQAPQPTGNEIVENEPGSVHLIVGAAWTRIVLSGEIDANLTAEFNEAMTDAEAAGLPIEVDAHHVTFMDSSGVAFLARLTTRSPHRIRVLRAPATMRFLLDVTRIGELLDILDEDPGFELAPVDEFTIERLPRQHTTQSDN